MSRMPAPVLIERALLLKGDQPDVGCIEQLVSFQRSGHRLILVAPRPRRWRPTRKSVDHDLAIQQDLHQLFSRAGAEIDAFCYLPTGLFSRKPAKRNEFESIARRYDRNASDLVLIGCDQALIEAFSAAGGSVQALAAASPDAGSSDWLTGVLRDLSSK